MLNKHVYLGLFVIVLFVGIAYSQGIYIEKSVPATVKYGDNLVINITILNYINESINITVRETITGAEIISPKPVDRPFNPDKIAAIPPYVEWTKIVEAYSQATVQYTIKPNIVGRYYFTPTYAFLSNGSEYYSNSTFTQVLCNDNSACEGKIGENYLTCPHDCKSGAADNICNPARDGICDPDCSAGTDLDCLVQNETSNITSNKTGNGGLGNIPIEESDYSFLLLGGCAIILIIILIVIVAFVLKPKPSQKKEQTDKEPTETIKAETVKEKSENICPKCKKPVEQTDEFCENCGFTLKEKQKRCSNCNAVLTKKGKFCPHCGAALNKPKQGK
jgi:RNA polymerase subunit RPABC4/transcription elongation factor Spt4